MVFGAKDAVTKTLDARDGISPHNADQRIDDDAMKDRGFSALWSILDEKGTST